MQKITPCLWFNGRAEEAMELYVSIFPNSQVLEVSRYGEAGPGAPGSVMVCAFALNGQRFTALNGGVDFPFTEAISLSIDCADQAEVDYYWERLTADGGEPVQCGWLKDKFGLSWQVVPRRLLDLLKSDAATAARVTQAMLKMVKLDIAQLEAAARG